MCVDPLRSTAGACKTGAETCACSAERASAALQATLGTDRQQTTHRLHVRSHWRTHLFPVAQAVALEAMRGAHRQQRACYLYAFSGPQDVKELELKVDTASLLELLNFMRYSFGGGTDVDRPLELSLDRLEQRDWSQVGSPKRSVYCDWGSLRRSIKLRPIGIGKLSAEVRELVPLSEHPGLLRTGKPAGLAAWHVQAQGYMKYQSAVMPGRSHDHRIAWRRQTSSW